MMQNQNAMRTEVQGNEQRITWIDVYKGIAICLMVVGHVTGRFNSYIFQFHMAAFFFISGYASIKGKRNTLRTIWDRFYTLLLPYFTTFLLMILFSEILTRFGLYGYLYTDDMAYVGIGYSIKRLLLYGNCYAWWLGAGWFCVTLFAIEVIHSVISALSGDDIRIYFIVTAVLYCIGYYCVNEGYFLRVGFISNDLVFIGLGFFGAGYLFRQTGLFDKIAHKKTAHVVLLLVSIAVLYYFAEIHPAAVQYPARTFNHPVADFIMGLGGCLLVYLLAVVFTRIKYLRKPLVYLGKNTLGIVFFHFQFFKIGYLILYLFHIVPFTFISEFLPTDEIGRTWWWMIAAVSILLSVAEWKVLTAIKGVRFFFGKDRKWWGSLYDSLKQKAEHKGITCRENLCAEIGSMLRENMKRPWILLGIVVVLLICLPLWNQGIMCNDELQYYYWSRQGFLTAYNSFRLSWIGQGRFLASIFTPIWMWLSMIGENVCDYRIIPVLSILLNITLFGILLYRLFQNKYFALFCSFILAAFLPVTFAPMAPNAYTTSFGIPFSSCRGAGIPHGAWGPGYILPVLVSL